MSSNPYDFLDYKDNYDIREPINSYNERIYDNPEKEFQEYKRNIYNSNLDPDMKLALIRTKRELIQKQKNKQKEQEEKIQRINLVIPIKLWLNMDDFTKISNEYKTKILSKVENWVNKQIELILLDTEPLYYLFEFFDWLEENKKIVSSKNLKQIFSSSNPEEFIDYKEMMDQIKLYSIQEEKKRIEHELQKQRELQELEQKQKELQEQQTYEINLRNENIKPLLMNLNKISGFDVKINTLKQNIMTPINEFCSLNTDYILLSDELYNETLKFINSIRIKPTEKTQILQLCKNI